MGYYPLTQGKWPSHQTPPHHCLETVSSCFEMDSFFTALLNFLANIHETTRFWVLNRFIVLSKYTYKYKYTYNILFDPVQVYTAKSLQTLNKKVQGDEFMVTFEL